MNKLNNEADLVKEAIRIGLIYANKRGTVSFDSHDALRLKIEYIYRLLVHDKVIQPLAKDQEDQAHMKHKLAFWVHKNLPENHPLKSG